MLDWALVAARLLQFTSGLVLFGSSLFYLYASEVGPADGRSRRWRSRHLVLLIAALSAVLGVVWWVRVQAAIFFPEASTFDSEPISILLTETAFGRVALLRIGLIVTALATLFLLRSGKALWALQTILGAMLSASFAWTGHGVFDEGLAGLLHTSADVLHLLAAGVWIGALVGLSVLLFNSLRSQTATDANATLYALERFSAIGVAVVSVLVLTGMINSWFLIGLPQWRALFTTSYGLVLVLKLSLLGLILALAALNRFRLSPSLRSAIEDVRSEKDRRALEASLLSLRRSVVAETLLATSVLLAVAYLGTLEPPISGVPSQTWP